MKALKEIRSVIDYYKAIKGKNLFRKTAFTTYELYKIEKQLESRNKYYVKLITEKIAGNKINVKALQGIVNEVYDMYRSLYSLIEHHLLPATEQTPLFRYTIEPDYDTLKTCFSNISVANSMADLINQLAKDFPNDIVIERAVKYFGQDIPYLNETGYYRHIFKKIISPEFLCNECYNEKKHQLAKIDEFLELFKKQPLYLPLNFNADTTSKDGKRKEQIEKEVSQTLIELSDAMNVQSFNHMQAFELFPEALEEENDLNDVSTFIGTENSDENLEFTIVEVKAFITLNEKYSTEITQHDYVKKLFQTLREFHQFISVDTKLSEFRKLFSTCDLTQPIILDDYKKFYAFLKLLKKNKIIETDRRYLSNFPKLFKSRNRVEINYESLKGSRTELSYREEQQILSVFEA